MALIYLAELTVYDLSLGAERTLRYSTGLGYRTTPAETPADTICQPRIQQPSLIRRDAFDGGTTFGASRMGYGEMVNEADRKAMLARLCAGVSVKELLGVIDGKLRDRVKV